MRERYLHLQFRIVARKPSDLENVLGNPNATCQTPAYGENHVVPDIDHAKIDVFTQTHRVDIALSASIPVGLSVHRFRKKAQVGNRPVILAVVIRFYAV